MADETEAGDSINAGSETFKYALGEKETVVLVVLQGKISHREIPALEEIESLLKAKSQPVIIFHFKEVSGFMPGAHAFLASFLKNLRASQKYVGICSIKSEIKTSLLAAGLLRKDELFDSMPEAWNSLKVLLANQKSAANIEGAGESKKATA